MQSHRQADGMTLPNTSERVPCVTPPAAPPVPPVTRRPWTWLQPPESSAFSGLSYRWNCKIFTLFLGCLFSPSVIVWRSICVVCDDSSLTFYCSVTVHCASTVSTSSLLRAERCLGHKCSCRGHACVPSDGHVVPFRPWKHLGMKWLVPTDPTPTFSKVAPFRAPTSATFSTSSPALDAGGLCKKPF